MLWQDVGQPPCRMALVMPNDARSSRSDEQGFKHRTLTILTYDWAHWERICQVQVNREDEEAEYNLKHAENCVFCCDSQVLVTFGEAGGRGSVVFRDASTVLDLLLCVGDAL